ncbi:cache domain-containing protein [Desulfobacter sp. UBA2225]|uniref:cache domain-containing protein n=1 Tax=Desulfobacter sp. UBA2225 TaxID=1961413 RepID=UPI00257CF78C|nr:cache domain-containing protein [Desulfobacter sp. UBA2225]
MISPSFDATWPQKKERRGKDGDCRSANAFFVNSRIFSNNFLKILTKEKGTIMKKALTICLAMVIGIWLSTGAMAADESAIKGNVDAIVSGIDGGKAPTEYKPGDYDPYVFIMERNGTMVVHPTKEGQSLNTEEFKPVYDALVQSTSDGIWVEYQWGGADKKTYVRTTAGGLIVGSGYTK